jgi:hypothetical protein
MMEHAVQMCGGLRVFAVTPDEGAGRAALAAQFRRLWKRADQRDAIQGTGLQQIGQVALPQLIEQASASMGVE